MTDQARLRTALAAWCRAYPRVPVEVGVSALDRRTADADAAWVRWHDGAGDAVIPAAHRPWYAALERARVEALAGADLPGMAINLRLGSPPRSADSLINWLYENTIALLVDGQRDPALPPLSLNLPQSSLRGWGFWRRSGKAVPSAEQLREIWHQTMRLASNQRHDGRAYAALLTELLDACARYSRPEPVESPAVVASAGRQPFGSNDELEAERRGQQHELDHEVPGSDATDRYRIYSAAWDELLTTRELDQLVKQSSWAALAPVTHDVQRLAQHLQRRLLAAQLRRWSFAEEDGALDNRRLASLLIPGADGRVFRREAQHPATEACVTLLVDQSGSMRGTPAMLAVQAIDMAVAALQRCGVRCEVLGYATGQGKNNPVLQAWESAGRPSAPGRLNALRHVVYKSFAQPWRVGRRHLPWVLEPSAGVENIDGEALAWAASRLGQQPQARKILLVICDGAPCDAATNTHNGHALLEDHLHRVIGQIEASAVHLAAIGTGRAVGRFYRNSLALHKPEEIASALFEQLGDLLATPHQERLV